MSEKRFSKKDEFKSNTGESIESNEVKDSNESGNYRNVRKNNNYGNGNGNGYNNRRNDNYGNGNDNYRNDNRGNNYRNDNRGNDNYSNDNYKNDNRRNSNGNDNYRNGNNNYRNENGNDNRRNDNRNDNRRNYRNNNGNGYNNYRNEDNQESSKNESNDNVNSEIEIKKADTPVYVKPSVDREEVMVPIETFDDLSKLIDLKIIRGVMAYGFEQPSPIQKKAIKPLLSKCDLIAQAQSGTGKTATFCIGTLGNLDFTKNEIQAIVIGHTMELAQQIEHVFSNIGKYTDLRLALAVKSIPVRENIDSLLGKTTDGKLPHVVIGTPGRVLDMINKKIIDLNTLRILILDEADELLSDGFIVQIKQIIGAITEATQIGLFSATMDSNFFKLTEKFLRDPINILIKKENLTLEGIKQYYINCEKNDYKFDTLCDLYSLFSTCQTIIYCNYHQSVELLTKKMQDQNFKVSLIHGSMDINQREEAMRNFRNLTTRVLISTDLLGRGIDVQQVSIVINYDIPFKSESYIHRIGRSGRHGRTGTAINFVTNNDIKRMTDIEKYYETRIDQLPEDVASLFHANE